MLVLGYIKNLKHYYFEIVLITPKKIHDFLEKQFTGTVDYNERLTKEFYAKCNGLCIALKKHITISADYRQMSKFYENVRP